MTDQEKRELNKFIAVNYMGWKRILDIDDKFIYLLTSQLVPEPTRKIIRFTLSHDSVALMEQKIDEMGLVTEYIYQLAVLTQAMASLDGEKTAKEVFKLKIATPLQCCIAAKRAWETLKSKGEGL